VIRRTAHCGVRVYDRVGCEGAADRWGDLEAEQGSATGRVTMAKMKTKLKAERGPAEAVHLADQTEEHHVVGLGNLRVVIVPDDGSWFAQGLDIDYAAQGEDIEEAKANFARGLRATINQHIQLYGNIKRLLKPAAPEICRDLLLDGSAEFKLFWQVSAYQVHERLPYDCINYLVEQKPAECGVV
jgi:hypothetical protein